MRPQLIALAVLVFGTGYGGLLVREARGPVPVRAEAPAAEPAPVAIDAGRPASPARPAAAPSREEAIEARVETALGALTPSVVRQSHPEALRIAFQAYYNYKETNPRQVRKPYLYFVDYGLDNRTPRGYVFDMEALTVVDGPFTVAHGRGSASAGDGRPTRFSNREGSNATSLGLYLAQETYDFSGKSSGRRYHSIGLRLRGLSGSYNSAARRRGVVVHGAPYVTASRAGRSEGCPAMEQERARKLIPRLSGGGLVFLFSPLDEAWMEREPWANLLAEGPAKG